jgi:hypothetical protein
VLKKIHLKHNATEQLALCNIRPDQNFVLRAALSSQPEGSVCKTCITAALAGDEEQPIVPAAPMVALKRDPWFLLALPWLSCKSSDAAVQNATSERAPVRPAMPARWWPFGMKQSAMGPTWSSEGDIATTP